MSEKTVLFEVATGFMNYKLCYKFTDSAGYFAYDNYGVHSLPVTGETMTQDEVEHVFKTLTKTQNIVTYLLRATTIATPKTDQTTITSAATALVTSDVKQSAKIFQVLYGMNYDFNSFAVNVVASMDADNITDFIGPYAQQVKTAYDAGNGEQPQKLLLTLVNASSGDAEKVEAILEGWRQMAESSEVELSTDNSFQFSDGSEVTLEPLPESTRRRMLSDTPTKVRINRFECVMIDSDITEGYCYEVLINGSVDEKLDKAYSLTYMKRDPDDTACATKKNIQAVGWTLKESEEANECTFSNGKAILTGTSFGVVTTSTSSPVAPSQLDTTVLTVLLVVSMIIFIILFIGLGYALWVYVHPAEPVNMEEMWGGFDEDRKKNLEQKRAERLARKQKLLEMEADFDSSDSDSSSDAGTVNLDDVYNDLLPMVDEGSDEEDLHASYTEAIRTANESSMYAQQAAENTDIVQEEEMQKEEDLGEVRNSSQQ